MNSKRNLPESPCETAATLKGALLVDVLQADYKELNGELPKENVG